MKDYEKDPDDGTSRNRCTARNPGTATLQCRRHEGHRGLKGFKDGHIFGGLGYPFSPDRAPEHYCQTRIRVGNAGFITCGEDIPCPIHTAARQTDSTGKVWSDADIAGTRFVANGFKHVEEQPAPVANDLPAVWGLVMKDMIDRDQTGRQRYGVPLQPHNGRDALRDAYEEALDLAVYLRQAIYERDNPA